MQKAHLPKLPMIITILLLLVFQAIGQAGEQAGSQAAGKTSKSSSVALSPTAGGDLSRQVGQVKQQLQERARTLFQKEPLGFDWQTVQYIYTQCERLPLQIPALLQALVEQSRLLGFIGSLLVLTFLMALAYSLRGQKRLMQGIEARLELLEFPLPKSFYSSLLAAIRVLTATFFPLLLLVVSKLISDLTGYQAVWFQLISRLLLLWAAGSLIINLLRELLIRGLFGIDPKNGGSLFHLARPAVLYSILVLGLYWCAVAFELRADVLALFKFAISLSIIVILFLLHLKKKVLLSMLPDLPHPGYQKFLRFLTSFYIPLIVLSLLLAVLWALGYRTLGRVLLIKIWSSVACYLAIMVIYHRLIKILNNWQAHADQEDETADLMFRAVRGILLYATTLATLLVVLNLLGLLGLLKQVMSFSVFYLGTTGVTLWVILEASLILLAFIFLSRLLQAYLDYRVYPAMGIEPGLGYAINIFLKYLMLAAGLLISLNVVGLDLRLLLVFTGAVGIGIGMGLQNMAANVISGFVLIFGGKLRKGDWIEVGDTMGKVIDIHLRATKVRSRDNIEYLIPNTKFISDTLVNYSLGSPLIRLGVPVGVSYNASPEEVKRILLEVASAEPLVAREKPALVYFLEFGDSSINFELLVWINIRTTAPRMVRSALYFAIFAALAEAGIEIPFPQRDVHLRGVTPSTGTGLDERKGGNAQPGPGRS